MTAVLDTVPLTPPVNLRDLGGVSVADGTVRTGFAIRADDLTTVPEEVADRLVADGLRAVIDLRSAAELGVTGRGPLGARSAVSYHHVPMLASIGDAADTDPVDQGSFGRLYLRMYEAAAAQIVTSLAVIAHAPGAVAFHCAAGQDRTGVLAASLLLVLGADNEAIVADYARTGENAAAIVARVRPLVAPLMRQFGLDLDDAARGALRTEFSEAPMRELLAGLAGRHGDPLLPLREAGLTDGLVARLRERGVAA